MVLRYKYIGSASLNTIDQPHASNLSMVTNPPPESPIVVTRLPLPPVASNVDEGSYTPLIMAIRICIAIHIEPLASSDNS